MKFWEGSVFRPISRSIFLLIVVLFEWRVSGICVWQGGGGFRLACGFKQSGLFRLRSLGGLKGWAGAGFTIGDEDGFKDSLTNKESKTSKRKLSFQHQRKHPLPHINQYGQYSHVSVNAPHHLPNQEEHESEGIQKRASLWNSWKWPSIIKKKRPRAPPHRMGPLPYMPRPVPVAPYSYNRLNPMYHPQASPYYPPQLMHQPHLHHSTRPVSPRFPIHPRHEFQMPSPSESVVPGFSPMPELDPTSDDEDKEIESQLENVVKALSRELLKGKRKPKKPYGLQLLQNSANYGTKFKVSVNSVPAEEEPKPVTGYDTNLFPDIYFTSTTPRNKLKKILEAESEKDLLINHDEESTTEAILRKLRLKKIKLLKKRNKGSSKKRKSSKLKLPGSTTMPQTTTTLRTTTTTQRLSTSPLIPSTTLKLTTTTTPKPTTSTTKRTTTTKTTEKPRLLSAIHKKSTKRPDYAGSFYTEREREEWPTERHEKWKYFSPATSPRPTPRPFTPIAQNPLITSGKWKEIYDPRYPPDHEVNRGKLEMLAAALTTTSQRSRYSDFTRKEHSHSRPDYFQSYPKSPELYPKRYGRREDEGEGLVSKVQVDGQNGQFVRFDSRESLNLVSRTKSYNDAFYSHFNKSAMEIAVDEPSPTPFHYFSAFYNRKSTAKPPISTSPPTNRWVWDGTASSDHFSRNKYFPPSTASPTPVPQPIDRWAGLKMILDSSSAEELKSRLDHSSETGNLLRQKVMSILGADWEPGPGISSWEVAKDRAPHFVTGDSFKKPSYNYSPETKPTTTTAPLTSAKSYFSSTPSFNEWKSYVKSVAGISSTPELPAQTFPLPTRETVSSSEVNIDIPQTKPNTKESIQVPKNELIIMEKQQTKDKGIMKVKGSTKGKATITTTTPLPILEVKNAPPQDRSENETTEETFEEAVLKNMKPKVYKHPKKPATAAFLPISAPSQMPSGSTQAPPSERMKPPPKPQVKVVGSLPSQNLGPPPPLPDFATSHLNEFVASPSGIIETDWNRHPLPTKAPSLITTKKPSLSSSPPSTEKSTPPLHVKKKQNVHSFSPSQHMEPPSQLSLPIHTEQQLQQRLAPLPPSPKPTRWNPNQRYPQSYPSFHGPIPIPYPPPRGFQQSYQRRPPPPMGFSSKKPIRHMIPGRPPPPASGPLQHPKYLDHMIRQAQILPRPVYAYNPQPFPMVPPKSPQIRPVQMLSPPHPPPPQIVPVTRETTTTRPRTAHHRPQIEPLRGPEKEMILKALQTLSRAKYQVLRSVVNEKYGGDLDGIVKVVTEIPPQVRPTVTTIMTTSTTTPKPFSTKPTVQTRLVIDEIPPQFAPLVNYVKNLKVPRYEDDKVQIDYFNFNPDEAKPKVEVKRPEIMALNVNDIAFLASANNEAPSTTENVPQASKFERMLLEALTRKAELNTSTTLPQTSPTPAVPSHFPTPLVQTLAQMGLIEKLQNRNVSKEQMDTIKKLIQLNRMEQQVTTRPAPPQPPPPPAQFLNNFHHILNRIPPAKGNRMAHRISLATNPSVPVQQTLDQPQPPTTPKPFNSMYTVINGPTLQALKAIALNRIQSIQPEPKINFPQQIAPEEKQEEITVDLSPILGFIERNNKPASSMRFVKARNAPKSYYPGERVLPFEQGKEILTNFQCERQEFFPGLYGDPTNSCKVFHLCAKTNTGFLMRTFKCPRGTTFDQEILRCNWNLYVDCSGVDSKYVFNKYLSQSFQFLKSLGEFSASVQAKNETIPGTMG